SSRKAPRLAAVGGRGNPDYLKAFIESPHDVKPGSTMPDLLGAVPPEERRAVAESITHYLVSLHKGAPFGLQSPDGVAAEQGEQLFHSVGCVACHAPRDPAGEELLKESSVPLGALEKKYSFKSLSEFLKRPHSVRPSGRMPDLRLPGHEVERISHYLLRETEVPGHLAFTRWSGKVWEGLDGDVKKERAGQVEDFSLERLGQKVPQHSAIQYSGFLRVESGGRFRFFAEMNGGSLLLNGDEVFASAPSDRRGTKKFEGAADLVAGLNRIELTYFHTGRNAKLSLEMEGPGFKRAAIPASMLTISDREIPALKPLEVDPDLVAKGKSHFERLGCAQCHDDIQSPRLDYTALADLDPTGGCLDGAPGAPRFSLGDEQRKLIAAQLPAGVTRPLDDRQMVDKTLVSLNCIACHDREGLGGISPDRDPYFSGTQEALGEQGRLPPPLTHVGAKLTKHWLGEVMLRGARQREYLNTRMPLFGEANVGRLVDLFGKVDSLEEVSIPKVANIRESKEAGYEMTGATGFSCIACHDFNGQKSGAGALELVGVTERINKNWFHLYMRQPSRFHPTVIMPSYWPGGESIRKGVLGGDTEQQIEALWMYLSDGTRAKNPKGLSRQSPELRVADETVMCRGRGTAGYRGIGVGYPERISLAFDSEEMALRLLWKGEFASVNNGSFRARGSDRIAFPAGIPFHRLESLDDAWPYKGKTNYLFPQDHGYQYGGYSLDQQKRPTFKYRYGAVQVEDFFEDLLDDEGGAYFRRTMTLTAPAAQEAFFFRVGSGKKIAGAGSRWAVDGLTLGVPANSKALVRDGDPQELLLQLSLPEGETQIQLEYRW
ncbi:MAG: hypothetical protein ACR2RV_26275, partial [Verrucomicrobiales bacterium]